MMTVSKRLGLTSALVLCMSGLATSAMAAPFTYSTSGGTTFALGGALNQPITTPGADADGGCDSDTGSFGCGDAVVLNSVSTTTLAVGTATSPLLNLLNTFTFHVEDSNGVTNGAHHGTVTEKITINTTQITLNIPYTVTFGTDGDTFQFDAGALGTFEVDGSNIGISSVATDAVGDPNGDDDDFLPGTLNILVSDPPAAGTAVPEPGSCVVLGSALLAFGAVRLRKTAFRKGK
ncbi:MAG: hypothetical protein JO255_18790 [Alphaproteobacteria bacterium]|nr:hypothetical protein [Alphaproteobacteria bacterium]